MQDITAAPIVSPPPKTAKQKLISLGGGCLYKEQTYVFLIQEVQSLAQSTHQRAALLSTVAARSTVFLLPPPGPAAIPKRSVKQS